MTSDWEEYKLSELSEIKGGKRLPAKTSLLQTKTDHPYIRVRDLTNRKILNITPEFEYVDDETQKTISKYIVDEGDVIISIVGTIGLVAIIGKTLDKANLTENCAKFINLKNLDNNFLYYYLISETGQQEIKKNSVGAVQAKLPLYGIGDIKINLPSLENQRKIAKVLSAIDDKIELNNKINENLEQQIKILYSNSFNNSDKIVDISSLIDVRDGTHDSPKPQISGKKLITSKHLLKYGVDTISANLISENDYKKINERSQVATNDILISMIGTVGLVSFVIENPVDFCVKNVGIFRTSQVPELIYYIHCFLNSNKTQNYIHSHLAGTTQKYISLSELRTLKIQVPQKNELINFNKLVQPFYNKIINNTQENQNLVQLRDTLLPKLMSGEIDVEKVKIQYKKD